jgi:hypothetical protein
MEYNIKLDIKGIGWEFMDLIRLAEDREEGGLF